MPFPSDALIDVHAHFVTENYIAAARAAGIAHPDGMPAWPTWSTPDHLDLMDRGEIQMSFLSVSSPGTHFGDDRAARLLSRDVNEYAARIRDEHPTRFGFFASLPMPDIEGSLREAAYSMDTLGADGIAVETNHGGSYLGDALYKPLWQALDAASAVVFVHPTSPPHADAVSLGRPRPMLEFMFDSARAAGDLVFNGVLTRYPRIQWVFTHGGGALPLLADRMELFRQGLRIGAAEGDAPFVTVQEQLRTVWFDMAGTPFPNQIPALVRAVGTERLLYGSDYCWTPPALAQAQISAIDAAPHPSATDTWRTLTTRNANRLLKRLALRHV
ncbi:amidohydrolase family protein [Amycolatopsis sp. cmx-8-4]|uniref:amidohydrolase family protein n=1 Tax=Amycolatopsis sp. cmx-8-4 TaxID=2790947 RepID=UPI00397C7706